jgi:hypothetical protein
MKLYTEEQVDKMLSRARMHKQDDTEMFTNEYLLSEETPIELPSDEEIKKYIESTPYYGTCTYEFKEGIEDGIKWMKKQILNQNK